MLISAVYVKLSIKLSTSDILSNYFLKKNYSEKWIILSTVKIIDQWNFVKLFPEKKLLRKIDNFIDSENYRQVIFCQTISWKKNYSEKLIILSTVQIISQWYFVKTISKKKVTQKNW
jgi:hypothetical protein